MQTNNNLKEEFNSDLRIIEDFPKKGISFKDINPVLSNPSLCEKIIEEIRFNFDGKIDAVCGIESRGFLFGLPIALALKVPFVMIRKKGKLPPEVISQSYDLEYGTDQIEINEHIIQKGWRVLVHDDVLATGGTARAASKLLDKVGASSISYSFLIELVDLKGINKLDTANQIHTILNI